MTRRADTPDGGGGGGDDDEIDGGSAGHEIVRRLCLWL